MTDNRNTLINIRKGITGIRLSAADLETVTQLDQVDRDRHMKQARLPAKLTHFRVNKREELSTHFN